MRLDRPGLDRVRDAAAARLIDAVVVLCPDRLARNYVHQALVLDELARFGVSVIFLEGGLADSPHGRLLAQVQAAVAEFERTKIVERNRRGKLRRARQGAVVSGDVPFGYRKIPASNGLPAHLEVHEQEAAVVRQIFHWHTNDGLSVRQIAIRLMEAGVPSPRGNRIWRTSSLDRLLHNQAYSGTMYFNRYSDLPHATRLAPHEPGHRPIRSERPRKEWIAVSVPAIIDLEAWTRSQTRHGINARFSSRHVCQERYLLRYLVRCGECGRHADRAFCVA
jgi:site-specific DNA recombinase